MDLHILSELTNKKGELKQKIVRITNKNSKRGLDIDAINELYKGLLKKNKPNQIMIVGRKMTGAVDTLKGEREYTTLKKFGYDSDELLQNNIEYQSNQPKEIQDKLSKFYSIDITIKY